jgi:hypothetical protein
MLYGGTEARGADELHRRSAPQHRATPLSPRRLRNGVTLIGKLDSEFASRSRTTPARRALRVVISAIHEIGVVVLTKTHQGTQAKKFQRCSVVGKTFQHLLFVGKSATPA